MRIAIRRLDADLSLPNRQHEDDAGYDLVAREDATIAPAGGRVTIPTGVAVAIPAGYAGFVQPRSGLAHRNGVTVLNTPGLVDSGYRDELRVIMVNLDPVDAFTIRRGDRIAQLVIQRIETVEWKVVDDLGSSDRGLGGFGSTGVISPATSTPATTTTPTTATPTPTATPVPGAEPVPAHARRRWVLA
jgi:dUTP pyrophosphatase